MSTEKNFYIIAGPNGAGKTTLSKTMLRDVFKCNNFVNADEIARGLSPLNNQKFDIEAGKLMLEHIKNYSQSGEDFCVETTLASVLYLKKIEEFKKLGYKTHLFFVYLPSDEMAVKRVQNRVKKGGHSIEEKVIRRRYKKGLENLMNKYFSKVENLYIYCNDTNLDEIFCKKGNQISVNNENLFNKIKKYQNV